MAHSVNSPGIIFGMSSIQSTFVGFCGNLSIGITGFNVLPRIFFDGLYTFYNKSQVSEGLSVAILKRRVYIRCFFKRALWKNEN